MVADDTGLLVATKEFFFFLFCSFFFVFLRWDFMLIYEGERPIFKKRGREVSEKEREE